MIPSENTKPVIPPDLSWPIQERCTPPSDNTNPRSYRQFAKGGTLLRIGTTDVGLRSPDTSECKTLADPAETVLPSVQPTPYRRLRLRSLDTSECKTPADPAGIVPSSVQPAPYQRFLSILPKRLLGFSFVGGGVMVGGMLFLFGLVHFVHVEQHLAYLLQAVASIETNFFLNRFTNWKDRDGNLLLQWIKFHSTSVVTFPLNQALFALLTAIGVHYLVVTIIGVGVAAVVNYIANDRFVFHRSRRNSFAHEKEDGQALPSFPQVGVIIPVRNSQRTIRLCVESVLQQRYPPGLFEIFLVGNPPDCDSTWQALGELIKDPALHCIQVNRPYGWTGRDANLKRYCGCKTAVAANAEVIALLDSQVTVPSDWLLQAVTLLKEHQVDGVAGKSSRSLTDQTFSSLYQDHSLFSEWPTYGPGFFLSHATFGKAKGLPITNNLFIRRQVWENIQDRWPLQVTYSWEDFRLAWEIVCAGHTLFCTDILCVSRHHQPKFRLVKHFASGVGAMEFYRNSPDCVYVKKRLFKARLVILSVALFLAFLVTTYVLEEWPWLALLMAGSACVLFAFGCISMVKARHIYGLAFPWFDLLHIGFWIAGATYASSMKEQSERETLAQLLVALR